jgi:signal transduction histidine kinase
MSKPRPLRTLLLVHELIFVLLVLLAGAAGGYGIQQWRAASVESVRISQLTLEIQQTRGDLYRQIKELFDARFLADSQAPSEFAQYTRQIDERFVRMDNLAVSPDETLAISNMRQAYHNFLAETHTLLNIAEAADSQSLEKAFNSNLELNLFHHYESVTEAAEKLFTRRHHEIQARLRQADQTALVLLAIPLALAVTLLLFSRTFLQRAIARPLRDVLRAANEISQGKLEHKVPETGAAELVQVASTINRMADDLTASREALVRSEKQAAQGALVPVLAHNIRNPLASIRATAQVADDPTLDTETRRALQDIISTVDRLENWTSSLLSYLHPQKPHMTSTTLDACITAACALLKPRLTEKQVMVSVEDCDGLTVMADTHLMEQTIYNLLLNALEASPMRSEINVTATKTAETVAISIADHGPGMPFVPEFNSLAPGPSTKRFGTGLGIPFAFKVCETHGGQLRFSNRESGGTVVTLALPVTMIADYPSRISGQRPTIS